MKNMMKKALAVLVILAMMIPFMPVVASAELPAATENWYKEYDEADESTYTLEINNINDFVAFMNTAQGYANQIIKLNCDIYWNGTAENPAQVKTDAHGFTNIETPNVWVPIATDFQGTFDGQGHTIYGLYAANNKAGIWQKAKGATIKNLIIEGASFSNNYNDNYKTVGAIVCRATGDLTFENVEVHDSYFESLGKGNPSCAGGILGNASTYASTFKGCVVSGLTLYATRASGTNYSTGAFVGVASATASSTPNTLNFVNCINYTEYEYYGHYTAAESVRNQVVKAVNCLTIAGGKTYVVNGAPAANVSAMWEDDLPMTEAAKAIDAGVQSDVLVQGAQVRESKDVADAIDARFIASVSIPEGKATTDIASIGFEIAKLDKFAANGATTTLACSSVFTSITSNEVVVATAAEYEADYLAALVITGIAKEGTQTVLVRAYYTLTDGETAYASDYALVTFVDGALAASCYVD